MHNAEAALFGPYAEAFRADEMLSDHAYSLCGGPCAGLFWIGNAAMLRDLLRICIRQNLPYKVLGGISNVLISDKGYDGIVLLNKKGMINHTADPDGTVRLTAGSGAPMAAVVRYCQENGLSGFEWAAGLPGTVGGAVYGNAGAFGGDISGIFQSAAVLTPDGEEQQLGAEEMAFGYRTGLLKKQPQKRYAILSADFRLSPGKRETILSLCRKNQETRREKQPADKPSLGSVFKNPAGDSAGRLIQAAGLKGLSIGKAAVSMKHANFITTEKGVRAGDYYELILTVQNRVQEMFGIRLEPEIEFLGFEES